MPEKLASSASELWALRCPAVCWPPAMNWWSTTSNLSSMDTPPGPWRPGCHPRLTWRRCTTVITMLPNSDIRGRGGARSFRLTQGFRPGPGGGC